VIYPRVCVVVSYWTGHKLQILERLLGQMLKFNAGLPFDLVVVCNGGDQHPLVLGDRFNSLKARVINRENTGYNLGAWNAGWEVASGYDYYLFLQDECFIKKAGWVSEFVFRMENDPGLGLLGETIMWDNMTWKYVHLATDRDLGLDWFKGEDIHPLDFYQYYLKDHNIPPGELGAHIQTLIVFTSDQILSEIGGLPVGNTYREVVACEIGLSALVRSKGYRISKVKDQSYTLLGHSQWTAFDRMKRKTRAYVVGSIKRAVTYFKALLKAKSMSRPI